MDTEGTAFGIPLVYRALGHVHLRARLGPFFHLEVRLPVGISPVPRPRVGRGGEEERIERESAKKLHADGAQEKWKATSSSGLVAEKSKTGSKKERGSSVHGGSRAAQKWQFNPLYEPESSESGQGGSRMPILEIDVASFAVSANKPLPLRRCFQQDSARQGSNIRQ